MSDFSENEEDPSSEMGKVIEGGEKEKSIPRSGFGMSISRSSKFPDVR
jgi:hypothetical protein